ncbi:terminase family protein [Vibrio fluvialis]|uniref:terminase large subunit domain-containing protein n=1 Tax=Vibrio fluvialis TaxID=676 RepID=UPI001C9BD481|nr:terminase family protein [Vibrio fluvialis]MBY8111724.1 terminase family protein [Vibrio fluvialis]MBY8295314.1 terminase family protein [Vibrio fluvialis]MCE7641080.1 terminase family protein [Vibrio fluvialis]
MNTETFDENDVLLPYQKRWIADESPLKIAEKSRRTGITWAEAADAALTASTAKASGGTNHFYVGSNKEMAREFIDAVAMWAKAFNYAAGDVQEEVFLDDDGDKEILTFVVYFASGFKVQALSSNPSNLRGMQGNVTIDEAAFHERLAEVLKAALALTMWGAKVRLISTHNGVDNLFNQLIQDSRAGKKRYSIHTITLDIACQDGLYKRICQVKGLEWSQAKEDQWKADLLRDTATEEDALEEYYCVPKNGGGAYISRSLRERAASLADAPVISFTGSTAFNNAGEGERMREMEEWLVENVGPVLEELPTNQRHALGEDFARNGDLTVFAPITVETDTKRTVPFLVELANVPFKQQEQALYYICDRLPRRDGIKLDARGNGQYLAEQARYRYGAEVEEVMLSVAHYRENMPKFKAAFEDDEIKLPKHEDVITDLGQIQIYRGVPGIDDSRTTGSDGNKRHGDSAVAIFLAFLASKEDITRYELHTIKADANELQRRFFGTAQENNQFDDMPQHDIRGKGIRL